MEKIKHIWTVLCTTSVIDQESNNITLTTLEKLAIGLSPEGKKALAEKGEISINFPIEIISMLKKDSPNKEKFDVDLTIFDPAGKEMITSKSVVEMEKSMRRMRYRNRIRNMKISISGDYIFRISIKEPSSSKYEIVAEVPLELNIESAKQKS